MSAATPVPAPAPVPVRYGDTTEGRASAWVEEKARQTWEFQELVHAIGQKNAVRIVRSESRREL